MDCSIEIRPLSEVELDNVTGGGAVGPLYFYNQMRDLVRAAGLTNPATETAAQLRDAFLGSNGPQRPVLG
jgi:hypothetical protein